VQNKIKEQYKLNSSSIWLLLVGASACTIYFNTKLIDPFNTPKLAILITLSGWMIGHLISIFRSEPSVFSSHNRWFWIVTVLYLASLLIAFFSTDLFITSLIGENQRRNGFLAYFSLLVIFIFTYLRMDLVFIERLIKTLLILGLILASYGILQTTGNDFVEWVNPYNPIVATLGNPNFASAFFAMILCLSVFSLRFQTLPQKYKILAGSVILLSGLCILRSQSRQGILAAALGITFYICCYFYLIRRKLKFTVLGISSCCVLISIFGMLNSGPLASALYKDSVSVRGYYWRAGIEMLKSHPILGVGLDRYGSYFKEFRESSYSLRYGFEITSSNAHNTPIQLFATGGLLLVLSYLVLLTFVFISGLSAVKKTTGELQRVSLALLATWIAFQAQSFISIDNLGLSIWGWVIGATILAIRRQTDLNPVSDFQLKTTSMVTKPKKVTVFQPVISALFVAPALIVSAHLFRFESDAYAIRSFELAKPSGYQQLILARNDGLVRNPIADPFYVFQSARSLYDFGEKTKALNQVQNLLKSDPRNLDYLSWLAWQSEIDFNYAQSINYRLDIARYDPWNASNYLNLGLLYQELGDNQNAHKMKDKVLSFAALTTVGDLAREKLP